MTFSQVEDNTKFWLDMIGREPLLTADEEIHLGHQIQRMSRLQADLDQGDSPLTELERKRIFRAGRAAKNRMIKGNLRLVTNIAKKYASAYPSASLLDLCQEGAIGLNRACEMFDPSRGYKLSTYAYWWIRQAVTRHLDCSKMIRIPAARAEQVSKMRRFIPQFASENHRLPTHDEIAEGCGIKGQTYKTRAELVEELLPYLQSVRSLDEFVRTQTQKQSLTIADQIACPRSMEESRLSDDYDIEEIQQWLDKLPRLERLVLVGMYGLFGTPQQSLKEIARTLGVSREKARVQHRKALLKIRRWANKGKIATKLETQLQKPCPDSPGSTTPAN